MRLLHRLVYLFCASFLSVSALACDNVTIRIVHGGPQGSLIRYRITIGAFQQNGVLAEGSANVIQCLNSGQTVSVQVYEVNGIAVNFPASGSPQTYTSGGSTLLSFQVTGSAPPQNWKMDAKTCNKTALPQYYAVILNGQVIATEGPIMPGDCFEFHYSDSQKKTIQFARYAIAPDGTRSVPDYSRTIDTNDPNWYQDGSASPGFNAGNDSVTHVPDGISSPDKLPWDNNASDPAKDKTLRTGFENLYNTISQQAQQGAAEDRAQTEKLTSIQNQLNSGFVNVNGNLVSMQAAINAVNSGVSGLGSKIDNVGAAVTTANTKLDAVNSKLGSLDSSLTAINSGVSTLHNDNNLMLTKLGNIDSDLQGVAKDATLSATKNTISSEASATRDSIGGVRSSVDAVNNTLGAADQHNAAGHAATKLSVDQTKSVLDSVYQALQDGRTENNVANSAIQGKLDTANQNLSDIKNNTANLASGINSLGTKIDNVGSKVAENTDSTAQRLDKVIKLLDHSDYTPDFAGMQSAGAGAAQPTAEDLLDLAGLIHPPPITAPAPSPWIIAMPGGHQCDLNPLDYPGIASFASWVRNIIVWVVTVIYIMACYNVMHNGLLAAVAARQGTSASVVPVGSSVLAMIAAGLVSVALAAIPAVGVAFLSEVNFAQVFSSNPLEGGGAAIQMGVSLASAFLPLTVIVADIALYFAFRIKFLSVFWVACTIVRFIVG